mgnify:CR=1 FL=1
MSLKGGINLTLFDHFFVQNSKSKELLNTININCVTVTGDSRFDRVIDNKIKITPETKLEQFAPNRNAFIIGNSCIKIGRDYLWFLKMQKTICFAILKYVFFYIYLKFPNLLFEIQFALIQ